jgi:chromosome segregation ATPase
MGKPNPDPQDCPPVNEGLHAIMADVNRRTEDIHKRIAVVQNDVSNLNTRVTSVETQMGTVSTHLATLVTEAKNTNVLLQNNIDQRQRLEDHRMKLELEDREWRHKMESARLKQEQEENGLSRNFRKELWETFRQPFGTLVLGVAAWLIYTYFNVPPTP